MDDSEEAERSEVVRFVSSAHGLPTGEARRAWVETNLSLSVLQAMLTMARGGASRAGTTGPDADDAAADAVYRFIELLTERGFEKDSLVRSERGVRNYLRRAATNRAIDLQRQAHTVATPIDTNSLDRWWTDEPEDTLAGLADVRWQSLTAAARADDDSVACAVLAAAWDLASTGQPIRQTWVARDSGYERTVVARVLQYAREFLSQGHTSWRRRHR